MVTHVQVTSVSPIIPSTGPTLINFVEGLIPAFPSWAIRTLTSMVKLKRRGLLNPLNHWNSSRKSGHS